MAQVDLAYSAEDLYTREDGRIYLTGTQALVRLPMMQRMLDRARGLNTAGLVSGYRGSPLGTYDLQLWKASKALAAHDIVFQPGLNEDLAATALWGAQMHKAYGETRVDGVFGIWYGKGPGVDRTGDVFRTANMLGTSALGGVLAVSGDDHSAQSSMYPHQTDGIFSAASIPVLQPSNLAEILEFGLAGIALSRFSGLWVCLKTIAEVIETAGSLQLPVLPHYVIPEDFIVPAHGLNWDPRIAWPGERAELERRLINERLPAALAWARANKLDRTIVPSQGGWLGIVTVGKAHQDLMQAVEDLGLKAGDLAELGIAIYKVAMSWPLETVGMKQFVDGRKEVFVVEEKRAIVEAQIKEALFHESSDKRPCIVGKTDQDGKLLLPEISEFTPLMLARALVARIGDKAPVLRARLAVLEARVLPSQRSVIPIRRPYFCSGCPHNTSTKSPDGSISGGGIGCHVMALSDPKLKTTTFSQMGGEGAQWIGAAPFSATSHVFQNLGDGTYQHSGLLAIRAAIAAKTNITYKILYNDAVAMTGGQQAEGQLDPMRITRQLQAEGVETIAFVSDDPERWEGNADLAKGVEIHHRDALDDVQRKLREVAGVSAIVYEQTCASEKRRRRKRNAFPDPDKRLFINHRVCEGCGDCSVQSNCIAVQPLETGFGRKREINQSACNKDFSCAKGFCPSFVEIDGVQLRKPDAKRLQELEAQALRTLPAVSVPPLDGPYNVYVTGIGGTGVLTLGALLGAAAHIEGKGASVLDFTGLAQKNGAVVSQIRIASVPEEIHAVRIGTGAVDLLIGTDLVVAAAADNLERFATSRTAAIVNLDQTQTADVVSQRDASLPVDEMLARVRSRTAADRFHTFSASTLAQTLFGDTVAAHTLMLGYAWQCGLVPLSLEALQRAIELNGAAVAMNKSALVWGRIAAASPGTLDKIDAEDLATATVSARSRPKDFEGSVDYFADELIAYQSAAYARRYRNLVMQARKAEQRLGNGAEGFAAAVSEQAFRLMAYKDEYEVARLYAAPEFKASLAKQFSMTKKLSVWLSPPLISRIDPATGRPKKRRFGPWIFSVFSALAKLRGLRGTPFDPFGYTEERASERRLIANYFGMIEKLCNQIGKDNHQAAVALAQLPGEIRGYGPVKHAAIAQYEKDNAVLLEQFDKPVELSGYRTISFKVA
jgi:indolepyruvate ferredoxin oxidoreductase